METIKKYLNAYSILKKRRSTIDNAFACAIAPYENYDEEKIKKAMSLLKQDPKKLKCVYCDGQAKSWDHLYGIVKNKKFLGYGHMMGNLLPCCTDCNSEKRNEDWEIFLKKKNPSNFLNKRKMIMAYKTKNKLKQIDYETICHDELKQLNDIKEDIFKLCGNADKIADKIREKLKNDN